MPASFPIIIPIFIGKSTVYAGRDQDGAMRIDTGGWGGPIFPPFDHDLPRLIKSRQALPAQPVKTIYPCRGEPFDMA